jgi:putative ATPase
MALLPTLTQLYSSLFMQPTPPSAESKSLPLAERMRPQDLASIIGQEHLTGNGKPLNELINRGHLPSMLLWGPPGVGKTTLAHVLVQSLKRPYQVLSAVHAGVKEVRAVIEQAQMSPNLVLFIDEIHRFNKGQQDALLAAVEQGLITLIGATTENPSFEIIPALRSRCALYILQPLDETAISAIVEQAIARDPLLIEKQVQLASPEVLFHLSGGDGRKALGIVELAVMQSAVMPVILNSELLTQVVQQRIPFYDKKGESYYDVISAFIKSVRGSDPHAAVYWLARMLEAGVDIRFIARRLIILASEDIGNANPNALLLATSCLTAIDAIGMPEARIVLSQTTTYLATSPKSNAAYVAINDALSIVKETGDLPVPLHLRNAPTGLMKEMGYGAGYLYSHDFDLMAGNQQYLPDKIKGTAIYQPKAIGKEAEIARFMAQKWQGWY